MNETQPILTLESLTKRFGSQIAVNQVSLQIQAGEVVALLGENGAGKSTLIKMLAGVQPIDQGEMRFHQQPIRSARSIEQGKYKPIAFIHQDLGLIEWQTVAENIAFSMGFPRRAGWFGLLGLVDWQKVHQQAAQALAVIGVNINPNQRVFQLSRAEKALVAIARAVAVKAEILVLDEPTASLPLSDVERVFDVLRTLKTQGVGMLYVTHRLDEVRAIADRLLVLRDGNTVAQGKITDFTSGALVEAITGKTTAPIRPELSSFDQPEMLRLAQVVLKENPISFCLKQGEILALAGLRGAGQEQIGRLLFGLHSAKSGDIFLNNQRYTATSPQQAITQGVGLVAGDRLGESLALRLSARENLSLNPMLQGFLPCQHYSQSTERQQSQQQFERFSIRPNNPELPITAFSGGNQQKVVLARWLSLDLSLLILEDPTAGVDVGARAEIYRLLQQAAAQGMAILIISSDFEEIAQLCHRALVFNRGKIVGELAGEQLTNANLLTFASDNTEQAV
ncbi:MAG: sugar ABC transporter ATP-binding protein [Pasteurellaceae bacterium]|nr:sugar ABC transporter ATP-binding protein [Pasteurellaceae bacterium]